ncbi:MAG: PASTA domain-containing protein [Thermodesulfobacteriota bacterium]
MKRTWMLLLGAALCLAWVLPAWSAPPVAPSTVGKNVNEAAKILRAAGFRVKVEASHSCCKTSNPKQRNVVAQQIGVGTSYPANKVIVLRTWRYSRPPRQVQVPDVRGMVAAQATQTLRNKGFRVNMVSTSWWAGWRPSRCGPAPCSPRATR